MLILGDEGHYHGRFPWVTVALVMANVFVFTAQLIIGEPFTNGFSLVPQEITTFQDLKDTKYIKVKVELPGQYDQRGHYRPQYAIRDVPIKHYPGPTPIFLTFFSSMFMHGSFPHLFFNMWFLLIFGRNVECALGHRPYLALYLACGVFAGLAHVASDPDSIIPCLGASGAIAGTMGAYMLIHPFNKIKIWLGFIFGVVEVPALIVIGGWVGLQYLSVTLFRDPEKGSGGVAYWAHLGGFFAGMIIIRAIVFRLQRHVAATAATNEDPRAEVEQLKPTKRVETADVKAEAPDPFEGFITMQTIRRMQEKKQQESAAV